MKTLLLATGALACAAFSINAATIVWTNSAGGKWSVATNWGPNQVPGPSDQVMITNGGVYTVTLDFSPTINSLALGGASGEQTLAVRGAGLVLNSGVVDANGILSLSNATLACPAMNVIGLFNCSGGTLSVRSQLTVAGPGVLNVMGSGLSVAGVLFNEGTVSWQGGEVAILNEGSTNFGTIWNQQGGSWEIRCDSWIYNPYPISASFHNAGVVRKCVGLGTTTFDVSLDNSGVVEAQSGTVSLNGGSNLGGSFVADTGAAIVLGGGSYSVGPGVNFSGAGTFQAAGANLTLVTDVVANLQLIGGTIVLDPSFQGGSITNLTLSGGTLAGTNTVTGSLTLNSVTVTGRLTVLGGPAVNWSGATLSDGGVLTVAANGVLNVMGNGLYLYGTLTNQGRVFCQGGEVAIANDGVTHFGSIWNEPGGLWDIECDYGVANGYSNGVEAFHNAGVVRKSAGLGTTSFDVSFDNSGVVEAQSGTVSLNGGSNLGGSFVADAGAAIVLGGGSYSVGPGVNFSGAGTFQASGANLTLVTDAVANLQLLGGTIVLDPSFQGGSITNLTLSGGTLAGTNTVTGSLTLDGVTVTGTLRVLGGAAVNWSGATLSDGGVLTVAANGVLNVMGNGLYLYGTLTNQGAVFCQGGEVAIANDGVTHFGSIWNQPGGLWDIQCDYGVANGYSNGVEAFHNAGVVRKSAGLGTTSFDVSFDNSGTLDAQMGVMSFARSFTQTTGTWSFALSGPDDYGQFLLTNAPFSGTLTVILTNGYFPSAGDSFVLVSYGAHSGSFGSVSLPTGGLAWQTVYGASALTLGVTNRALPAGGTNFAWLGGVSSDWFTAANWSPPGVPGPHDIANITNGAAVLFSTGASVGVLNLSSSALNGSGTLTVLSNCNWNGGTLNSSLTIAANGVLNVIGGGMSLYGALTNQGSVCWQGGDLWVYNNGANSFGMIWNQAGALWNIECDQAAFNQAGSGVQLFHNAGVVRKSAGVGTTWFYLYLDNSGLVEAQSGTLSLNGGSNLGGSFVADAGAAIVLGGGSYSVGPGVIFNGAGTFQASAANLTLFTNLVASLQLSGGRIVLDPSFQGGTITNLTLSGGTLAGANTVQGNLTLSNALVSGTLTVLGRGSVNWSGATLSESGVLTVAAKGVLNVMGGGMSLYGALTNQGSVCWQGDDLWVNNNGANSFGVIWNEAGALWNIECDQAAFNQTGSGLELFHNAGVLRKSAGVGTTWFYLYLDNSGLVEAQSGTLSLNGGSNLGGSFVADEGAAIVLGGGSYSVGPGVNFSGAGTFQASAANLTLFTNLVANLQLSGGTIVLDPSFQGGTITNLTLSGGTLAGANTVQGNLTLSNALVSGTLTVLGGGSVNWSGATFSESGVLTVAAKGVLNVMGGGMSLYGALTNQGSVCWQGGDLGVYNNGANSFGVIWNQAGALWNIECDQAAFNQIGSGLELFHNAGVLRKSAGLGTTWFYLYLDNSGLVEAQSGTLNLAGGYTLEPGGMLSFGINGLADFGQITLSASGVLAGTVGASLNGGYLPEVGDSFAVLNYPSSNGVFDHLNLPANVAWQTNYGANTFTLSVSNVLRLAPITDRTADELTPVNLRVSAEESYAPPKTLSFSLLSAPAGMTVNPNTGAICWSPLPNQSPSTNTVVLLVSDNSYPPLQATDTFTVIAGPPVLAENMEWGFEYPAAFPGWTPSGSAFANGPVTGDWLPVWRIPELQSQLQAQIGGDYWSEVTYSVGHKGHRWVCTAANVQDCGANASVNDSFNEALTGSLVSQSFVIASHYISFLIGGTAGDPDNLRVELLVQWPSGPVAIEGTNYNIAAYCTGHGRELMRRAWFDVSGLRGSAARIRILDNSTTGHLNVDDFRFPDMAPTNQTVMIGTTDYPAVVQDPSGFYYDWDSPLWGFADLHCHPMSYLGFGGKFMHGWADGVRGWPDDGGADPTDVASALANCNCDHGGWGADNTCGDYFRQLLVGVPDGGGLDPHQQGWDQTPMKQFSKWPVFTSISHQQMWYEWIQRSYYGGQRVMVALAVNSQLIATVSKGDITAHDDRAVADLQIEEMKNFVARHNDFMEIAYDPVQLRDIVRRDKLAIILGVEIDDLGGLVGDPQVTANSDAPSQMRVSEEINHLYTNGVRYAFTVHLADNKFGGTPADNDMCNVGSKFNNGQAEMTEKNTNTNDQFNIWLTDFVQDFADAQDTINEVDAVLAGSVAVLAGTGQLPLALTTLMAATPSLIAACDLFVPQLTPLGPNSAGAAFGLGLLPVIALPLMIPSANDYNFTLNLLLTQVVGLDSTDTSRIVNANLLPLPGNYPHYYTSNEAPYGVRNVLGLTPLGQYAVQQMMSLGMMLDVDHMGRKTFDDVLSLATSVPGGYPLNSGHNGFMDLSYARSENTRSTNQLAAICQLGGMMGVGWANSPGGSWSRAMTNAIHQPQFTVSQVANDCAGTSKTWAQLYLYALEKFHATNVALGTDTDGFIELPGPRFGPQSAYGLQAQSSYACYDQVAAQHNGVLYTPQNGNPLMTAFNGRAVDSGDGSDGHVARRWMGYAYSMDQACFFAAIQLYYYEASRITPGETQDQVDGDLQTLQGNLSSANCNTRAIKELAFGMIDGLMGWGTGSDLLDTDVGPLQELGKSVWLSQLGGGSPLDDVMNDTEEPDGKRARYEDLLIVWDHYQRILGNNAPLTRCQTGDYKQWDINFEGVAHYGLIPDFLQDLSNVGLQPQDMSVLFHSAEAFAQMWVKCLQGSYALEPHFVGGGGGGGGAIIPLPNGTLQISYVTGFDGAVVEESGDLKNWQAANVLSSVTNAMVCTIQVPATGRAGFYRLRHP
jgi:hypothetical protein